MRLDQDDDFGTCPCGSAWFNLLPHDEDTMDALAAVCIDMEGGVTGYAGKLACVDCGLDWNPALKLKQTSSHLRVVV